jgi:hypothetical protein
VRVCVCACGGALFLKKLARARLGLCVLEPGEAFKGSGKGVGVRFNPGLGSGGTSKTNVGGPSSSFGIWHEQLPQVQAIVKEFGIKVSYKAARRGFF